MSIFKNLSTYEKMLQNPKNQKRSYMKPNMPSMSELRGAAGGDVDLSNVEETVAPAGSSDYLTAEQESQWSDIDSRMVARRDGKRTDKDLTTESSSRVAKLEKDVADLKEMMMHLMKTHMKLIND